MIPDKIDDKLTLNDLIHIDRRGFLTGATAAIAAGLGARLVADHAPPPWRTRSVFVARASSYQIDLESIVKRGLAELGIGPKRIRGKSILLKPNLVEPYSGSPHINTHPVLIAAVVEAFRSLEAREVFIAEGPGHVRDARLAVEQAGLADILKHLKVEFIDLNHDDVDRIDNALRLSPLAEFYLPKTLRRADWVVSLPKLKTHHWVGATVSLKNLFGVLPGVRYGWPKNVLHQAGIVQSILDLNAAVRPRLAIVDGIVGMEGDGPIMGPPKELGAIVMGENLVAVDSTATRLMRIDPATIEYLAIADRHLGPIDSRRIRQIGEPIDALARRFEPFKKPQTAEFHDSPRTGSLKETPI
jgi:uncharacterized protein (DUF362 family)